MPDGIFYIRPIRKPMVARSVEDVRAYRKCPLAYTLGGICGEDGITPWDCLGICVREAVHEAGRRRILGTKVLLDELLDIFHAAWERESPRITGDVEDMTNLGERCISNYMRMMDRDDDTIAYSGVHSNLELPGGFLRVEVDEITVRGSDVTLCNYITATDILSKEDLKDDERMGMAAIWVMENMPGAVNINQRWRFLISGLQEEMAVSRRNLEDMERSVSDTLAVMDTDESKYPKWSDDCKICIHRRTCPLFMHDEISDAHRLTLDEGRGMVDEYIDLEEKILALKHRQQLLEAKQDAVGRRLIAFADANGFMAVTGKDHKALIKHERKVELPKDKTELVALIRDIGEYDRLSGVNYSKLRSEILGGRADPRIAAKAEIVTVDKVYIRKRDTLL